MNEPPEGRGSSGPCSARWWITDSHGRVVVAQPPNAAIAVWLIAVAIGWSGLLEPDDRDSVRLIGSGALLVWGADELFRGASPARRVFGAGVLGFQVVRLVSRLTT